MKTGSQLDKRHCSIELDATHGEDSTKRRKTLCRGQTPEFINHDSSRIAGKRGLGLTWDILTRKPAESEN